MKWGSIITINFFKVFKNMVGITPVKYRKDINNKAVGNEESALRS